MSEENTIRVSNEQVRTINVSLSCESNVVNLQHIPEYELQLQRHNQSSTSHPYLIEKINNKVDKIEGKSLSQNDLTNELKNTYDTYANSISTNAENIGDLSNLATTNKSDLVSAVNEIVTNAPILSIVATSGDYDDLTNKPTIPAAQIQSDWTETDATSKAYIQNKPTLSNVATTGDYDDLTNKPTIPAAQIQSDWNQTDSAALDYIKNKPSNIAVPTTLSSFTDDLGSNPVHTHSQYANAIAEKADNSPTIATLASSGNIPLDVDTVYKITPNGNVNFNLPIFGQPQSLMDIGNYTNEDPNEFHQILVQVNLTSVQTINVGTSYFFNKTAPDLSTTGMYNLIYEYDSANGYWICGSIVKGAAS